MAVTARSQFAVVVLALLGAAAELTPGPASGPAPGRAPESRPAPARTSAGATSTNANLGGTSTVWGHDDSAAGVERVDADTLARVDLFRELWTHAPSAECQSGLREFLDARDQLKLWALKMQDASVALPGALLSGRMYSMGDFDECAALPSSMYCLPDVVVRPAMSPVGRATAQEHPGDELSPYEPPHGRNATLWDLFKTSGNRRRYRRDLMQWALCLPAACSADAGLLGDAVAASVDGLARTLGVELVLHLDPADCTDFTDRASVFEEFYRALQERPLFLYGSLFVLAFPLTVLAATVRVACRGPTAAASQSSLNKPGAAPPPQRKLDCFALQANWGRLRRKQPSQIHCIQGVRTLTMLLIVFGHRALYQFTGPLANPEYVEDSFTKLAIMVVMNGNVIVSTFFVISGFLEARLSMIHIGKLRRYNLFVVMQHYVIRYLRLLPALAVVLTVESLWVEHLGDGPRWNQVVGRGVRDCKANWWAHLLFVNNYVTPDTRCLIQTWFTSAVLQLYVGTPLLMWLVSRWTLRATWPGCLLLGLLLVAATGALYASTLSLGLMPMLQTYPQILRRLNVFSDATFTKQYISTHGNAVPYVVGLIVGTLFYLVSLREWRPSKRVGRALFIAIPASLLLQLVTLLSGAIFFMPTFASHPLLDAAYGPARLLAFSLPTAVIIFTCAIGAGGVFEKVLTWRPMVALGRLTYSVYLVHLSIITVTIGYTRQPVTITNYTIMSRALSDIAVSYILGLVLHLCVEAPCANLQGIAIGYWFLRPSSSGTGTPQQRREETPPPPEDFEDADDLRSVEEASMHTRSRRASSVTSARL